MLDTILETKLDKIEVEGGNVLHGMKRDDFGYSGFGEAYFSLIAFNAKKAWKQHLKMTLNLIVPIGKVKFVFCYYDTNNKETFRVEEIGEDNYIRLTVPPGIWFGFQGLNNESSLVMNIASIPHDPSEVIRKEISDINYKWS